MILYAYVAIFRNIAAQVYVLTSVLTTVSVNQKQADYYRMEGKKPKNHQKIGTKSGTVGYKRIKWV